MIVSSVREWGDAFRTQSLVHMRENTGTTDFMQTFTKYDSRSSSLMATITEPDVMNSCQSQLNSENWKLRKMIRAPIWVRWGFALSLPAQKFWNKELFLHFKVALPTARATIFRGFSNRNRERWKKTSSDLKQWALETSYLRGKTHFLGTYYVYIINTLH